MNTFDTITGLTGEIANHIHQSAFLTCPSFALGGAIATVSTLSKARYLVAYPEIDDDLHTVYQGVSLDGPAACGKTETINMVDQLVHGAGALVGPNWEGSQICFWNFASQFPGGLVVFNYFGHHDLQKIAKNKAAKTVVALLESAHKDFVARPFASKHRSSKDYLPPAPITLLTKLRTLDLSRKLPMEDALSHYFGLLLHMPYDGNSIVNSKTTKVADGLIASLKALYELSQNQSVEVRWSTKAREMFIEFVSRFKSFERKLWKEKAELRWPPQVVSEIKVANIAALIAVGCNSENPMISLKHLEIALGMVDADWCAVRAGLDVEPLAMAEPH